MTPQQNSDDDLSPDMIRYRFNRSILLVLLFLSVCVSVCRYCALLQQKDELEAREGRGLKEKEELNLEFQKNRLLQQENLQLKTDVDR